MIEGGIGAGDPIAGPYEIWSVFGTDVFFEIFAPGLPAITATNYTIRPVGGTNGLTGLPGTGPLAYVTVPNHGYPNGQEVRIAGASPAGYNGTQTITVCDGTQTTPYRFGGTLTKSCFLQWDMFTYPLASALGPNTSTAATASIKSTLARATSVAHGFATGDTVTISGASPNAFNGTVPIIMVDADTFTYTIGSAEGDAAGTVTAIGSSGSGTRTALINWVRGQDNFQDENTNLNLTDVRASVHGDVLHSRPAVVNYNRFGSDNDVYVFYGANDGIIHAIKGGYASDGADPAALAPGREAWGFIPKEFFSEFQRMRNNSPTISSSFKKPYFADGPIGIYTNDANGNLNLGDTGDVVNLYVAMRRGGRFIYALDVNNPNDPRYLWKIDNTTTGFSELGQTWSEPKVVTNLNGYSNPVLIFGAGYDPAVEDIEPSAVTSASATSVTTAAGTVSRTMGRGIYVVDAITGALVWSAGRAGSGFTLSVPGMDFAIPSDISVIKNASAGGPVTHAYVGDTGGNVWRIDFAGTNLASSTVTQLAAVGDLTTAAGRRKFQFPPDVVAQVGFDAVLIGSGDREHPFDTTVVNRMYMFKDQGNDAGPKTGNVTTTPPPDPAGTEPIIVESALFDATTDCIQDPAGCSAGQTQTSSLTALNSANGWFITLGSGEKVVGNAVSIAGITFFNTNQPSSTAGGGACGSNLGIARQYEVATADATATNALNTIGGSLTAASRSSIHAGGGYLPSPVHVVVVLGGRPVEAVISGTEVRTPAGAPLSARLRKYWYKEIE
jgi:type IV pilus assembly protein PilY1